MLARNGGAKISAMCAVARKLVPMLLHLMQTGETFRAEVWFGRHGVPGDAAAAGREVLGAKASEGSIRCG
jgi:hypothetical protein